MSTEYEAKLVYGRWFKEIDEAIDFLQGLNLMSDDEAVDAFHNGEFSVGENKYCPITWNPDYECGGVCGWHITMAQLKYSLPDTQNFISYIKEILSEEGNWGDEIDFYNIIYTY